jgi:hypothetical protein
MAMGYSKEERIQVQGDDPLHNNPFKPRGGHYSDEATLLLELIRLQKETNELLTHICKRERLP